MRGTGRLERPRQEDRGVRRLRGQREVAEWKGSLDGQETTGGSIREFGGVGGHSHHQPTRLRRLNGLCPVGHPELCVDVVRVLLDRTDGQEE